MPSDRVPTAVDLFCGAGGFSMGLQNAGFSVLCAADHWSPALETYRSNFTHPLVAADLAATSASELAAAAGFDAADVDVVVGGPPCQGFSIQRIGADHDTRNNLVPEFARLVCEFRPKLYVMENVPGLLGKRGQGLARAFESQMAAAGYVPVASVVNAANYGAPQLRRRVLCFGWRRDQPPFALPAPTRQDGKFRTVGEAIGDLPSPPPVGEYDPRDPLHRRTRLSPLNQERIALIPPGGGMEDLPPHLRVRCHQAGAAKIGHRYVYGRLAADRPAATITARFDSFTRGKFGHPSEPRNITLREGARLQTFPDAFAFAGSQEEIAALIGNAVPPVVAEAVARSVRLWLSDRDALHGAEAGAEQQLPVFA